MKRHFAVRIRGQATWLHPSTCCPSFTPLFSLPAPLQIHGLHVSQNHNLLKIKCATREVAPTSHFFLFSKRKRVMWERPPTSHFFFFVHIVYFRFIYLVFFVTDTYISRQNKKMRCGRSLPHHAFSFWKTKKIRCGSYLPRRAFYFSFFAGKQRYGITSACEPIMPALRSSSAP